MNKAIMYVSLFLVMIASVMAQVGSIDTECQSKEFDFGIVKYEWDEMAGTFDPEDPAISGYTTSIDCTDTQSGEEAKIECMEADWTSIPDADGILVKGGTETDDYLGGTEGTVYCVDYDGTCHGISHVTFCGNYENGNGNGNGDHPVPEFSIVTLGLAVIGAGLGLVFIRKRD
ncbi:MAG TPA: hypothetical protein VJ461_04125 [Candidatus Nanoarchaeia archaeon]|nr:hypothetical protein [Candidatus Nanoarchaeia archaeon]